METANSLAVSLDTEVTIGTKLKQTACAGSLVAEICNDILGQEIRGGSKTETSEESGDSTVTSFTASQTLEQTVTTSDNPGFAGRSSDLVLTYAISIAFEKVEVFSANRTYDEGGTETSCAITSKEAIGWQPSVGGTAIKSIFDIEEVEIPNIEALMVTTAAKLEADEYGATASGRAGKSEDQEALRQLNASLENWKYIVAERDSREQGAHLVTPNAFNAFIQCKIDQFTKSLPEWAVALISPEMLANGIDCSVLADNLDKLRETQTGPGGSGNDDLLFFDSGELLFDTGSEHIFFSGGGASITMATSWTGEESIDRTYTSNFQHLTGIPFFSSVELIGIGEQITLLESITTTVSSSNTRGTSNERSKVEFTH